MREQIGKSCNVNADDLIVLSKYEEDHVRDVNWVLRSLNKANMRVFKEKSRFFYKNVGFLSFVVTSDRARRFIKILCQ